MAEQALDTVSASGGQTAEASQADSVPLGRSSDTRGTSAAPAETRREALRRNKGGDRLATAVRGAGTAAPAQVTPEAAEGEDAPKPWEAPAYAKQWREQRQKALQSIATHADLAEPWKEINGQLEEFHQWDARRNYEIGNYRKRLEPIHDILGQMEQQYQLQGMSVQQGLGQLWAVSQQLARDPDSTLAWLGQQFKPQNANQVIQALAQAWGSNLGELAQGQPYVDPILAKQLQQTQAALQQMQQGQWQQQQAARQQQYHALVQHITEFETAKDEGGNPKHPYAAEVGQDMGLLLQTGRATSLEQAYEIATRLHPKAQEDRQKAAEKKARADAARNTTDAEQARTAARNISGKPNGRDYRPVSMDDAISRAAKQVYGTSR